MDLQTRKLNFIKAFLQLESEKAISSFEKLLQKEIQLDAELKPMTLNEFEHRIEQSNQDSINERLTDSKKLISEIDQWI